MTRKEFIADALASCVEHCIVWPFAVRKSSGYGAHSLCQNGRKSNCDIHRHVCQQAHGDRRGMEAAHRCGNKLCINPRHLYWATHLDNMADAKEHGRLKGGGRYRQRFFAPEIAHIRASNDSLLTLAAQYDTDVSYIGRLRRAA